MAISLSPIEILKFFRERGIREHQAVVAYLESIAGVATKIVDCWIEIADSMQKYDHDIRERLSRMAHQLGPFYEASEYYKRASTILGGKLNQSEMDDLFEALGSLLSTRNETKKLYELEIERQYKVAVFGKEYSACLEKSITVEKIRVMIDAMQREAAVLRALATGVRALKEP